MPVVYCVDYRTKLLDYLQRRCTHALINGYTIKDGDVPMDKSIQGLLDQNLNTGILRCHAYAIVCGINASLGAQQMGCKLVLPKVIDNIRLLFDICCFLVAGDNDISAPWLLALSDLRSVENSSIYDCFEPPSYAIKDSDAPHIAYYILNMLVTNQHVKPMFENPRDVMSMELELEDLIRFQEAVPDIVSRSIYNGIGGREITCMLMISVCDTMLSSPAKCNPGQRVRTVSTQNASAVPITRHQLKGYLVATGFDSTADEMDRDIHSSHGLFMAQRNTLVICFNTFVKCITGDPSLLPIVFNPVTSIIEGDACFSCQLIVFKDTGDDTVMETLAELFDPAQPNIDVHKSELFRDIQHILFLPSNMKTMCMNSVVPNAGRAKVDDRALARFYANVTGGQRLCIESLHKQVLDSICVPYIPLRDYMRSHFLSKPTTNIWNRSLFSSSMCGSRSSVLPVLKIVSVDDIISSVVFRLGLCNGKFSTETSIYDNHCNILNDLVVPITDMGCLPRMTYTTTTFKYPIPLHSSVTGFVTLAGEPCNIFPGKRERTTLGLISVNTRTSTQVSNFVGACVKMHNCGMIEREYIVDLLRFVHEMYITNGF